MARAEEYFIVPISLSGNLKKSQSRKGERLVFFYCSKKQAGRTTSLEVLRSFIAQLTKSIDGSFTPSMIEGLYESRKKCPIEIQECSDLLVRLLKEHEKTTFVVDALDECEDADKLLLNLKNSARNSVKFLFSSRNQVQVDKTFPSCRKLELDSQKDWTVEDMKTYVTSQVKERELWGLGYRLLDGKHPQFEDMLIEVLIDQAQGMYVALEFIILSISYIINFCCYPFLVLHISDNSFCVLFSLYIKRFYIIHFSYYPLLILLQVHLGKTSTRIVLWATISYKTSGRREKKTRHAKEGRWDFKRYHARSGI